MLTYEEEIKVRLFQSIADNAEKLCDATSYLTSSNIAIRINKVYDELFNKPKEEKK